MTAPAPGRARLVLTVVPGLIVAALLWWALYHWWSIVAAADPLSRLMLGLQWSAAAVLLTLVTGIEAVAHERLFTPAFDPLAGRESRRLKVNLRYLQNTLEQVAVFAPGLMLLAWYSPDGSALRMVPATAITWIAGRWAFWIGYHVSAAGRGAGIFSMMLGLGLLAYGVGRFGHDLGGWAGVMLLLGPFVAIEAFLVAWVSRPDKSD